MTARKPKPKPRTDPAIRELRRAVRSLIGITDCQRDRIEALESRDRLRDKSHDEPVSNAGEAIGQHFRIVGERAPWWRRLIGFMGAP